jgi:hypothetical protein
MRTTAVTLAALLFAGPLVAQTNQQAASNKPNYSRPALIHILSTEDTTAQEQPRVEFPIGAVQGHAIGTRWLIGYLPFLMPLSGSVNTGRGFGSDFPNPFALTHTEYAYTSRTWRDRRALSKELRRIESEEKKRAQVKVNPE